jgi:hypothetical protein
MPYLMSLNRRLLAWAAPLRAGRVAGIERDALQDALKGGRIADRVRADQGASCFLTRRPSAGTRHFYRTTAFRNGSVRNVSGRELGFSDLCLAGSGWL